MPEGPHRAPPPRPPSSWYQRGESLLEPAMRRQALEQPGVRLARQAGGERAVVRTGKPIAATTAPPWELEAQVADHGEHLEHGQRLAVTADATNSLVSGADQPDEPEPKAVKRSARPSSTPRPRAHDDAGVGMCYPVHGRSRLKGRRGHVAIVAHAGARARWGEAPPRPHHVTSHLTIRIPRWIQLVGLPSLLLLAFLLAVTPGHVLFQFHSPGRDHVTRSTPLSTT